MAISEQIGLGGGCTANGLHVYGQPSTSIASPSVVPQILKTAMTAGARGGGGGGGSPAPEPPEPTCDVFIGVVENAPSGGFGPGTVRKVRFNADGSWTATGETVSVIFPRI